MNIKQAAEQSGVSARNIRYYEQAGLLTPARNPENEYRIYSQADVRALKLIRMLRTLDMPVEEIGTVLNGTLPLAEAAERQRQRLEAEQQKLAAAAAFCTELAAVTDWTEDTNAICANRQLEILTSAAAMLRPGGRLVYRLGAGLPENGGSRA